MTGTGADAGATGVLGRRAPSEQLLALAADVGTTDPVVALGGRTSWTVGGSPAAEAREVAVPSGILELEPAEMTVRVLAGTTVADLDAALAESRQCVALPVRPGSTVGGVLALGRSGLLRLGYGPVRDTLLEARYVNADGRLITAGGPTVKNVSGFDLCRLLVGSLGTLGILGEVVLRTRPVPEAATWMAGPADPFALRAELYRPSSLLWDGTTTWALIEGTDSDVDAGCATCATHGMVPVEGPPERPAHRASLRPSELAGLPARLDGTRFVAEIGVGIVHAAAPIATPAPSPAVRQLCERIKTLFDPTGRLAPGRSVLATADAP